jgi:hypothetical protein
MQNKEKSCIVITATTLTTVHLNPKMKGHANWTIKLHQDADLMAI